MPDRDFIGEANRSKLLPVAVHIHGGSYARGSGDDSLFPHYAFARAGIVTVTLNYRLGLFGFMTLPQLMKEDPNAPANFGFLDQRLALQWVQENIGHFGGDAREVTVFGESAGAGSILHQMTYKLGTQPSLFKRAFLASPAALSGPEYEMKATFEGYRHVVEAFGCDPEADNATECLRQVPHAKFEYSKPRLMVFPYVTSTPAMYQRSGWPVADHVNFPDVGSALVNGDFNKDIEVIVGNDLDEGRIFTPLMAPIISPSEFLLKRQFEMVYGQENGDKLWEIYKPQVGVEGSRRKTPADSFGAITGDTILNCPSWQHTRSLAMHSHHPVKRFGNEWAYKHATLSSFGAFHTSSVCFFYNNSQAGAPYPNGFTPNEQELANVLFQRVIDFVKGKGVGEEWKSYTLEDGAALLLTANKSAQGNVSASITHHWKNDDCAIWSKLFPPHGLWAPACSEDIWAEEEFIAYTLNGAIWWVFLNLRLAGILFLSFLALILVSAIYCCCKCCKCCKRNSKPAKPETASKLKKD